jgi:hypothetical protein
MTVLELASEVGVLWKVALYESLLICVLFLVCVTVLVTVDAGIVLISVIVSSSVTVFVTTFVRVRVTVPSSVTVLVAVTVDAGTVLVKVTVSSSLTVLVAVTVDAGTVLVAVMVTYCTLPLTEVEAEELDTAAGSVLAPGSDVAGLLDVVIVTIVVDPGSDEEAEAVREVVRCPMVESGGPA